MTAREARTLRERAFTREDIDFAKKMTAWAKSSASASKLAATLLLATEQLDRRGQPLSLPASAFDADDALLVVRNGALELRPEGVRLREHRRADLARLMVDARYDPAAPAVEWESFLAAALPDSNTREYVQRLAGYSLLGGNPDRRLVFLVGPTSTGKTTFVETVGKVLGEHASAFDLSLFRAKQDEGPRADLVDALGRRFLFTTEASGAWVLHADQVKRITGNDTMRARRLYASTYVERRAAFTPWVATNAMPRVLDAEPALWRRLVAVPFRQRAEREDHDLSRRIVARETAGVLRWLVEGLTAYWARGLDDMPTAVVEESLRMRTGLSPVDQWIGDVCESDVTAEERLDDLWSSWEVWADEERLPARERLTRQQFVAALDARQYPSDRRRAPGGGDNKVRFRAGLRLPKGVNRVRGG